MPTRKNRNPLLAQNTSRLVLPSVLALTALALATLPRKDEAQQPSEKTLTLEAAKPTQTKPTIEAVVAKTLDGRRPLEFYTKGVRAGLFSEPIPPPPPAPKPIPVPVPKPAPPVVMPPINPFADWACTGTVSVNGEKMALLENSKTKEGQYLRIGEIFMGAQVSEISDMGVSIMQGAKRVMIAKSQNMNLVPLNANAGAAGGQPGGAPSAPGGAPPPPPPGGMPMMGQPMMMMGSDIPMMNNMSFTSELAVPGNVRILGSGKRR